MKTHLIKLRFWLLFAVIVIASLFFLGWGVVGHKIINQAGAKDFPDVSVLGPSIVQRLYDSSSVPDWRHYGSNGYTLVPTEPNHFMDMEDIAGFSTHSITHNRDSLFLKYGEAYIRNTVGFLPWVIDSVMSALTDQMRNGDWNKAWSSAADLGHYIGDAHQPLHATTNYNGYTSKYSGSSGIHSRYESTMISSYQSSILIDSSAVHYIDHPLDTAFAIMYQSNSYVDSVYIADLYARTVVGSSSSQAYIDTFWEKSKGFTILQFQRAAVEYGSYLYTAWINAESPSTLNPVPTTTSITPSSKNVGDAQFTMTVNGTNFISGSVVYLGGSNRVTTYISSTQLTVTIPEGDMTTAGTYDITVLNTTPGGGTSNAQTFRVIGTPHLVLSRANISIGNVAINTLKSDTVTIWNKGTDTLNITSITSTNTQYAAAPTIKSISPSGSMIDTIKFIPTAIGTSSAKLFIASNNTTTFDTINVSGSSPMPVPTTLKTSIAYSNSAMNTTKKDTLMITNSSINTLIVDSIYTKTNVFAVDRIGGTVGTDTMKVVVSFTPSAIASYTDTLYLRNNSATPLIKIPLSGNCTTGIEDVATGIPNIYSLAQNFPNPFNPSTTLRYGLPSRSNVRILIYNIIGQVIKEMVNTEQEAGYQSVVWNANVSSGIYFYRIEATSKDDPSRRFIETKKMLLLR
jgi:hypothetical protein